MSRQNYYAARRLRQKRQVDEALILELVREERKLQPRIGARKLLHMYRADFKDAGIQIGRDRFYEILARNDLLVLPKPGRPRTTNSRHSLGVFPNLIKGLEIKAPNEVWVSDITYLRTEQEFLYLSLIMDAYSRKIVGYHVGDNLESEGCLMALDMALKGLPEGRRPVHHSDRGCQYCCHRYTERLREQGMAISMTEILHCYENSKAERLNGILKQEYELDRTFRTKEQVYKAVGQAIGLYNYRRPHLKLNNRIPATVHQEAA